MGTRVFALCVDSVILFCIMCLGRFNFKVIEHSFELPVQICSLGLSVGAMGKVCL